ncbi:YigZ family protein [Sulfurimonas sp.]|uniref:YigZ family protein n=1 Tax=Sulfurimonas sp. TaxID=2022749 RepID=UPI0026094EB0|nr:YigZ family protein [Sulfurimonas sp.]
MFYIKEEFVDTLEVKQSKFIAHLVPHSMYKKTLESLQQLHPKARHFVTAFRYLNEYNQIVEHSSDDGEPSGTSGKPSLMVLQGHELVNAAVIIVRYFGGTKLGTGGLVRAYSDAVNLVVKQAQLFEYKKELTKKIVFNYTDARFIDYECQAFDIVVVDKFFGDKVTYTLRAAEEDMKKFLGKVIRLVEIEEE